jgi:RNA recognition motif-containing protein
MRRTPFTGNIIVSNLPSGFTGSALAALFDDYGLVLGAVINRAQDGAGSVRGLVNLAPPKAVEAAVGALDGLVVEAHHLRVRKAPPPPVKNRTKRPPSRRPPLSRSPHFGDAGMAAFMAAPERPARTVIVERRPLSRLRLVPKSNAGD